MHPGRGEPPPRVHSNEIWPKLDTFLLNIFGSPKLYEINLNFIELGISWSFKNLFNIIRKHLEITHQAVHFDMSYVSLA
jgi:hypothetical protein